MSRRSSIHGNIPIIACKHKLTRRGSRDAETDEEEQGKAVHLSNARTTCGPIYSGRRCCVTRRQCRVSLLGVHVLQHRTMTVCRRLFSTSDSALGVQQPRRASARAYPPELEPVCDVVPPTVLRAPPPLELLLLLLQVKQVMLEERRLAAAAV